MDIFWQIVSITISVTGIILAILWLWLKDKTDERYVLKQETPAKQCYETFITKEMHTEKDSRLEDSIESLKHDLMVKFDLMLELIKSKQ